MLQFLKTSTLMSLSVLLVSCGAPEDTVPTGPITDSTSDLEGGLVLKSGSLAGVSGYASQGDVQLILSEDAQTYSLVMENFVSSNGPDLRVYLSEGTGAAKFVDLGGLKSVEGTLRYDFAADQFDPDFDHVLIWCRRFGMGFGEATLVNP